MGFRISDLFSGASSPGLTGRAPQRWAKAACWGAFASALPSVGWRIAMLAGLDTGFAQADLFRSDGRAIAYVATLETVQVAAATACLGLCYSWGERVPSWVPRYGGRTIHRRVPIIAGGIGAAALYAIIGTITVRLVGVAIGAREGWTPWEGMSDGQRTALIAAYTPAIAWPIALTAGLVGYWRRRAPE